jgi:hypothetical protein
MDKALRHSREECRLENDIQSLLLFSASHFICLRQAISRRIAVIVVSVTVEIEGGQLI